MQRLGASLTAILSLLCAAANTPALAEDAILRMTRGDCKRLVAHQPGPDVAYRPGIDVRGQAVVPAEIGGNTPLELSDDLLIPLELDLLDRLGAERRAIEARVVIGTIELRAGRAYFNGRPLEDATAAELAEKCREGLTGGG